MSQTPNEGEKDMSNGVMLALSNNRRSQQANAVAIEMGRADKKLMVVYVIDINAARYLTHVEEEFFLGLRDICESEMLETAEKDGHKYVETIAKKAREKEIDVETLVRLGRFAPICLEVVNKIRPSKIVTVRSTRPEWVKKFYGSPVEELIAKAGCPVIAI